MGQRNWGNWAVCSNEWCLQQVAPRAFELQHDIASAIALEPLNGDRRARDVAAQAFERLALMLPAAHPDMQAEAVRLGAQHSGAGFLVPTRHGSQAQHLLSGTRSKRDAIRARGRLQGVSGLSGSMSAR